MITGNLVGADPDGNTVTQLLEGKINVPLTTYFTVGNTPLPAQIVERIEQDEDVSRA